MYIRSYEGYKSDHTKEVLINNYENLFSSLCNSIASNAMREECP